MNEKQQDKNIALINQVDIQAIQFTIQQITNFQTILHQTLIPGKDFGLIPGAKKPSLFKPGAEKILMILGLKSRYEITKSEERPDDGFILYEIRCSLYKGDELITEGLGAANSFENKYKDSNPYAIMNTLLKMAKKRAQVDASLTVASLSDLFTQDLEDMDSSMLEEMKRKEEMLIKYNQERQQQKPQQSYTQSYQQPQQQQQNNNNNNLFPGLYPGQKPTDKITPGMGKRLYARSGYNNDLVNYLLNRYGYSKREDITLEHYDLMVQEAEEAAAKQKQQRR